MGFVIQQPGVLLQKNFFLFQRLVFCPCNLKGIVENWRNSFPSFSSAEAARSIFITWIYPLETKAGAIDSSYKTVCLPLCIQVGLGWVGLASQSSESFVLHWKLLLVSHLTSLELYFCQDAFSLKEWRDIYIYLCVCVCFLYIHPHTTCVYLHEHVHKHIYIDTYTRYKHPLYGAAYILESFHSK